MNKNPIPLFKVFMSEEVMKTLKVLQSGYITQGQLLIILKNYQVL